MIKFRLKNFSTYTVSKDSNLRYKTRYNNYIAHNQKEYNDYIRYLKSQENYRINTNKVVDASGYLGKNYKINKNGK